MNFELQTLTLPQSATQAVDALVVLWPDATAAPTAADGVSAALRTALPRDDWDSGVGKLWASRLPTGVKAAQLVLVRAGDGSPQQVRQAVVSAMGSLKSRSVKHLVLWLGALPPTADSVQAAMLAVSEASYSYTTTLSQAKPRALKRVVLGVEKAAPLKTAFERAQAVVHGSEFAREWANRPGNHATPTHLGEAAEQLGKSGRIKVEVLGPKEVKALGMGAFMAVAQGSEQPLRFIVMQYNGAAKAQAPVVLVGKGISFDTGGISLKPAPEMDEMKFDMSGAASVLGVFAALERQRPAINVVGLIPTCENMPDGRAVKPGDVVTSMSGQTIEILNTDAEGRLVLCDALTYAKRFKPRAVIDIATLTGACVIALGHLRSGLFSNNDALASALSAAGEAALDPCWRLPLDDAYADGLKTPFADVANVAGRAGGSVTAAKFLQRFVGDAQWAHLDIAGSAWKSGANKGATGRPVGLLLHYLWGLADTLPAANPKASRAKKKG